MTDDEIARILVVANGQFNVLGQTLGLLAAAFEDRLDRTETGTVPGPPERIANDDPALCEHPVRIPLPGMSVDLCDSCGINLPS